MIDVKNLAFEFMVLSTMKSVILQLWCFSLSINLMSLSDLFYLVLFSGIHQIEPRFSEDQPLMFYSQMPFPLLRQQYHSTEETQCIDASWRSHSC